MNKIKEIKQRFNMDDLTFPNISTEIIDCDSNLSFSFGLRIFTDFSGEFVEIVHKNKKIELSEPSFEDVKEAVNYIFGVRREDENRKT